VKGDRLELVLTDARIGPARSAALRSAIERLRRGPPLAEFAISWSGLGDVAAGSLAKVLRDNRTLRVLDLCMNSFGPAGADALAGAVVAAGSACALREVRLDGNRMGDEGCQHWAQALRSAPELRVLALADNGITGEGAGHLAAAIGCARSAGALEELSLRHNVLGALGAFHIARLLQHNRSVRILLLGGCHVGDAGAFVLADALCANGNLEALELDSCGLGAQAAKALGAMLLANRSLRRLSLRHNALGRQGAECLGAALEANEVLEVLNISETGVGPAGACRIAHALRANQRLQSLAMDGVEVGNAEVYRFIEALMENCFLTELTASMPTVSPDIVEMLEKLLTRNRCVHLPDASARSDSSTGSPRSSPSTTRACEDSASTSSSRHRIDQCEGSASTSLSSGHHVDLWESPRHQCRAARSASVRFAPSAVVHSEMRRAARCDSPRDTLAPPPGACAPGGRVHAGRSASPPRVMLVRTCRAAGSPRAAPPPVSQEKERAYYVDRCYSPQSATSTVSTCYAPSPVPACELRKHWPPRVAVPVQVVASS